LYDKLFSVLAYPFCLFDCYVCGSSLLRWSSIYWCEQKREVLVVDKEMMIPLLSFVGWSPFLRVLFRVVAHVSPCFEY